MTVWFTSDTHFGHANIIRFCNRPFESADAMNEALIARWNDRVAPDDTVWHLGDFSWRDPRPYLSRLNGHKNLVIGNHEPMASVHAGWSSVQSYKELTVDGAFIILCHYGLRVWNQSRRGALHFYGHSHGRLPGDSQSCDVGVDCWDYRPVGLDEIRQHLSTLMKRDEDAIEFRTDRR